MINIENILNMIVTETIETIDYKTIKQDVPDKDLLPIDFKLEFIESHEGKIYLVE